MKKYKYEVIRFIKRRLFLFTRRDKSRDFIVVYPSSKFPKVSFNCENYCSRINGPAVIHYSGKIEYQLYDALHRVDGPAVIYGDGSEEYWVYGVRIPKMEFFTMYGSL